MRTDPPQLPRPATREVLPDHIGKYRIIAKLGEGGLGVVSEAQPDSPRRTVALKVISAGVSP